MALPAMLFLAACSATDWLGVTHKVSVTDPDGGGDGDSGVERRDGCRCGRAPGSGSEFGRFARNPFFGGFSALGHLPKPQGK